MISLYRLTSGSVLIFPKRKASPSWDRHRQLIDFWGTWCTFSSWTAEIQGFSKTGLLRDNHSTCPWKRGWIDWRMVPGTSNQQGNRQNGIPHLPDLRASGSTSKSSVQPHLTISNYMNPYRFLAATCGTWKKFTKHHQAPGIVRMISPYQMVWPGCEHCPAVSALTPHATMQLINFRIYLGKSKYLFNLHFAHIRRFPC